MERLFPGQGYSLSPEKSKQHDIMEKMVEKKVDNEIESTKKFETKNSQGLY